MLDTSTRTTKDLRANSGPDHPTRGPEDDRRPHAAATVPALFDEQARRGPNEIAVLDGDRKITRAQLQQHARVIGRQLAELGVTTDAPVAVVGVQGSELIAAVLGVQYSGTGYLPLAERPRGRLRKSLKKASVRVVMCGTGHRERVRAAIGNGCLLVEVPSLGCKGVDGPPRDDNPRALAYVIFTSGSTGEPKGVAIEQSSIVAQLLFMHDENGIGPGTLLLQKTEPVFDAAQWELLAVALGATVVAGSEDLSRDATAMMERVRRHRVNTLQLVPAQLTWLLEQPEFGACTSLQHVFVGGQVLNRGQARRLFEVMPSIRMVNLYGPTECTINASSHQIDPSAAGRDTEPVSIGRPAAGSSFHVVDESMQPLPVGEVGELLICGPLVARGYLGDAKLTASRFITTPFGRAYRSGDLAEELPDGTYLCLGRNDDQVKIGGYRVELGEISAVAQCHDWVRHAQAVTRPIGEGLTSLVLYVELDHDQAALMDHGEGGRHHLSKDCKTQVSHQLSSPGRRSDEEMKGRPTLALPGRVPTEAQRSIVFGRKTYRTYDGGAVSRADLESLLASLPPSSAVEAVPMTDERLAYVLRFLGQFPSSRLLPKMAYASPGALYGVQAYLELCGRKVADDGLYYYDPASHQAVRVGDASSSDLRLHLVGRREAIAPVYRTNIWEVLELEAGHLHGMLDKVLAPLGWAARSVDLEEGLIGRLGVHTEHRHLATLELAPGAPDDPTAPCLMVVQAHEDRVAGLDAGMYLWDADTALEPLWGGVVRRRDVIAINQGAYERSSFGVGIVARDVDDPGAYRAMGRLGHHLQTSRDFGLMQSGYSSRGGHDLPSARRIDEAFAAGGEPTGRPSYFFVGGPISAAQREADGLQEDAAHMRGPAEILRDHLAE